MNRPEGRRSRNGNQLHCIGVHRDWRLHGRAQKPRFYRYTSKWLGNHIFQAAATWFFRLSFGNFLVKNCLKTGRNQSHRRAGWNFHRGGPPKGYHFRCSRVHRDVGKCDLVKRRRVPVSIFPKYRIPSQLLWSYCPPGVWRVCWTARPWLRDYLPCILSRAFLWKCKLLFELVEGRMKSFCLKDLKNIYYNDR